LELASDLELIYAELCIYRNREQGMALVKKSSISPRRKDSKDANLAISGTVEPPKSKPPRLQAKVVPSRGRASVADRLAAAAQELASGLSESASAVAELTSAMAQISSGAEEAAGAAQESLGLIGALGKNFQEAKDRADISRRQAELVIAEFGDVSAQIESSVSSIELSANRQIAAVEIIEGLENSAKNIDELGTKVADISDQTSLLALNATIEAARAGDSGRGFAVVADEVRALAEASEASAGEIQVLARGVSEEIRVIGARARVAAEKAVDEAQHAKKVAVLLDAANSDLSEVLNGAQTILESAIEAEVAAREAQRGAEQIASAAEEQSAAAVEAQQAVQQQSISLDQSQQTAEALSVQTEQLQSNGNNAGHAAQLAAAAEELSATVQELSGTSSQILVAVEQIGRGAMIQASATLQANSAMVQIERSADFSQATSRTTLERIRSVIGTADEAKTLINNLVTSIESAIADSRSALVQLGNFSKITRTIEKITDALALVAVQTSMLAVSGSVEATRAGDAGRGFATVSSDVRKLARDSAANAERAKDVVRSIQESAFDVRRDLDQTIGAAEAELTRNRVVVARFVAILEKLELVREASESISHGSDEIFRSVREIQSGTQQIATAAEEASAAVAQAGSAARQQTQAAEELAAAIEDIASLANSLVAKGD
jgi:methyl-accepting chemotaxis protein